MEKELISCRWRGKEAPPVCPSAGIFSWLAFPTDSTGVGDEPEVSDGTARGPWVIWCLPFFVPPVIALYEPAKSGKRTFPIYLLPFGLRIGISRRAEGEGTAYFAGKSFS